MKNKGEAPCVDGEEETLRGFCIEDGKDEGLGEDDDEKK